MLSEKTNKPFGGMCKTVKSNKTVGGDAEKSCSYDKNYHYPSSDGCYPNIEGGKGADQHTQAPEYHNKVSK